MDTFNLGPALVINREVQDIASSQAAQQGDYQWSYPQQRIALVQTGHLEYAIVEVFGQTDSTAGLTLEEFAELVAEKVPEAIIAYNFDGGGSTNLIMNNKKICKTPACGRLPILFTLHPRKAMLRNKRWNRSNWVF